MTIREFVGKLGNFPLDADILFTWEGILTGVREFKLYEKGKNADYKYPFQNKTLIIDVDQD